MSDFTEHPYYKHVHNCEHCSGPHGHCAEGLRLKNTSVVTDFTEQARQLVKHISDAALELAFVRHSLTSDEVIVDDDADVKSRVQAEEEFCERVKEDTLNCLTGDDTGCLDPEELDESNCELLWTQSLLNRVAAEAATQGQQVGIERAIEVCTSFYERWQRLQAEVPSVDKQSWNRFSHIKNAAHEIRSALERLNPDANYLDRVRNEAATTERERIQTRIDSLPIHIRQIPGSSTEQDLYLTVEVIAAIGDDSEHGNRD